jgi:hypothetical protein
MADYDGAMQRVYIRATLALSVLMLLLGVALIVSTVLRGGEVLALGVLVGAALTLAGSGRLWLLRAARGEDR